MYVNFNENPRGNYYAGDCVIRAINIVTGISWDEIYTILCAEGFYLGDWGNTNASWDWYLRSLVAVLYRHLQMFMKNIGKQEAVVSFYIYKNLNRKEWSYEGITSKIGKAH